MRKSLPCLAAFAFLAVMARPAVAEQAVLSEQDIKRVVNRHSHEIRRCYEKHALKQRRARGRVTLGMVVARDGKVRRKSIDVRAPGVRGRKFRRCVSRRVRRWAFPSARSATEVLFPFHFQHSRRYR